MDILFLVDKLEKLLQDSRKMPMSNLRLIDENGLIEIIDQMRTAIPEEVKTARQIMQQKDRIVAQGKEEANRLVQIAQQQAGDMLSTSEVTRAAEGRSRTIIERAQRDAAEIRRGADVYAEQVLTMLDERMSQAQHQVRSGLVELANRRGGPAQDEDGDDTPR